MSVGAKFQIRIRKSEGGLPCDGVEILFFLLKKKHKKKEKAACMARTVI